MGRYDSKITAVKRMINKYGQQVTYRVTNANIADLNKPWIQLDDVLPVEYQSYIIFLSPSSNGLSRIGQELLQYMNKDEVAEGTIRGYMAASTFTPKLSDIVVRDGEELKIDAIDTLAPNGQVIMHILEFS